MNDPLDPLLDRWRKAPPPMPGSIAPEVWRRIALAEENDPVAPTLWERIEAAFRQPAFAATFIAACTLCGLFLAELRVSHQQAQRNVQIVQSYLRLIDPLIDNHPADQTVAASFRQSTAFSPSSSSACAAASPHTAPGTPGAHRPTTNSPTTSTPG